MLRLKDVATIERRLPEPEQFIRCYNSNQHSAISNKQSDDCRTPNALLISMEMEPGNNIVAFGETVQKVLDEASLQFPPDIRLHRVPPHRKV